MTEFCENLSCLPGCHTPVPRELEAERLCVLHYILSVERACSGMRRETVIGGSNPARQSEIGSYVKTTAEKLSHVAVVSPPLSDEMKKRVLTTFLTLMNLRESLDRSTRRGTSESRAARSSVGQALAASAAAGR
ncbi:MAG TPA: hypothetical protein VNM68_06185 [Candidatus Polarisedimenticolia bacterium]|nr:hypothetical protein [Candidatus Polarisedimenticolia bacterium]